VSLPETYLVSACLLNMCTRYDGFSRPQHGLISLAARGRTVPICPEVAGGLPIPRPPAEIVGGDGHDVLDGRARVLTVTGVDVTAAFIAGAEAALAVVRRWRIQTAVLQPRSPSCGSEQIHDGRFRGCTRPGPGVTAALLMRHGVRVVSPEKFAANDK
jgi:uncharacterized protein YbbK (DUF523 family)